MNTKYPKLRAHIIEFNDIESIVKTSERALYKMKIDKYWVLYSGEADCDFIGLHIFISDKDIPKYLMLDVKEDAVLGSNILVGDQGFVPVVNVKNDPWSQGLIIGFMKKYGYIEGKKDGNKLNDSKENSS